ncbi:peptidase C14, caspase domain-containing protein [Armillaria borealis]|uniref:Peptidase C14, caspase domain-containing protein n=1 Tax=Armillaria borealis TaxID=47425 RepID=A0AA39MF15_9AGAR|nr:peptidase C14, caspase domain-containing protein [Armillaria borealis]
MNIGYHHYDRGGGGCLYDALRSGLPPVLNLGLRTMRQSTHQDPELSGCKRAVCIGINHGQGKEFSELRGSILDAGNIRDFLMRQGYNADDILMLTDDTEKKPTKSNIIEAMSWLVQSAKLGDSLFLHYSGHGDWVPDQNGDEVDGKDEDIICYDSCPFIDDDIRKTLVDPLPAGCQLTALFDSCHSGTILDLPYAYDSHGRPQRECALSVTDPLASVICWSGATDDQNCADTLQGGFMTQAFIKSLEEKPKRSYKELLHSIREIVKRNVKNQTPQLTSSHQIDTNLKFIL